MTTRGFNALHQYLIGVIVAGVNGGINVYLDAFLTEEYYKENPEDESILLKMCDLLTEEKEALRLGLELFKREIAIKKKANYNGLYDTVAKIYETLAANIDKSVGAYRGRHVPVASSPRPVMFPMQSINSSLRISVAIRESDSAAQQEGPQKAREEEPAGSSAISDDCKKFDERKLMADVSELSQTVKRRLQNPPSAMLFSNRAIKPLPFNLTGMHEIPSSARKPRDPLSLRFRHGGTPLTEMKKRPANALGKTVTRFDFRSGTPLKTSENDYADSGKPDGSMLQALNKKHPDVVNLYQGTPLRTQHEVNKNIRKSIVVPNKGCVVYKVADRHPDVEGMNKTIKK